MSGFLSKIFRKRPVQNEPKKERVAIYAKLIGGEYGSLQERDDVRALCNDIDAELRRHEVGIFDGDEFGNYEAGLFIKGENADRIFSIIEPTLRASPLLQH